MSFLSLYFHRYQSLRVNSFSVIKFPKSIRTHFTCKKIFSNKSEFHRIFSLLKNIISLHLPLIRVNVKVLVIMEGNHSATWEFSGSNEIRIKSVCLLCERTVVHRYETTIPLGNIKLNNYVLAFHYDTSSLFSLPI